eukprot:1137082-Pelagomonas_calceolata.AAC.1
MPGVLRWRREMCARLRKRRVCPSCLMCERTEAPDKMSVPMTMLKARTQCFWADQSEANKLLRACQAVGLCVLDWRASSGLGSPGGERVSCRGRVWGYAAPLASRWDGERLPCSRL